MESEFKNQIKSEIIEAPWRRTGMGAVTHPVGIKKVGNKLRVVRPRREIYSRTHSHGTWLYKKEDLDALLFLEQSNSGKPDLFIQFCNLPENICQTIYDVAYNAWVLDDARTEEVEKLIELITLPE